MSRQNAISAKELSLAERQGRLARLVESGVIPPARAKLIDFREPSVKARAFAEKLVPRAKQFLSKERRATA